MLKLYDKGVYLLNGTEIVEEKEAVAAKTGKDDSTGSCKEYDGI